MLGNRWLSRLLSLAAVVAVFGCAPASEPSPVPEAPQLLLDGAVDGVVGDVLQAAQGLLLRCEPLPYQQVAVTVGSKGGVVRIGPHVLEIPRNALSRNVTITAEIPSDPVNSIRFGPAGLKFATSTKLTMSYANCQGILLPKRIAYTTDDLQILELLRSADLAREKKVAAPVDHFSRYAIAY